MSDIDEISSIGSHDNSGVEDNKSQQDDDIQSDVESEKSNEEDVDDEYDIDKDETTTQYTKKTKKNKDNQNTTDKEQIETMFIPKDEEGSDEESEVSGDEEYYKKFENNVNKDHIIQTHHHIKEINYDEINALTKVVRDSNGIVIDPLHKTLPVLTRFERAKVIGQRATQLNNGAQPFIQVQEDIIDGLVIAEMELKEKAIPFIIVRPLPNGKKEYWKLSDLENIDF